MQCPELRYDMYTQDLDTESSILLNALAKEWRVRAALATLAAQRAYADAFWPTSTDSSGD